MSSQNTEQLLCYCGCDEEATEECYECSLPIADECHSEGTCSLCAGETHGCGKCAEFLNKVYDRLDKLFVIRRARKLNKEDKLELDDLCQYIRGDWGNAVVKCLKEFA